MGGISGPSSVTFVTTSLAAQETADSAGWDLGLIARPDTGRDDRTSGMRDRRTGIGVTLAVVSASLFLGCQPRAPPPVQRTLRAGPLAGPHQGEERRIAGAEGWLHGRSLGVGPELPVVFMHGVGEDHSFFDFQLAEFRGSRQVIAFDQRGCGGSADAPGSNYDLDTRVGDLAKLSDALRLERLVVVGHGTGGQVVARYAERNSDRVRGLVLVNPVSSNAEAARIAEVPERDIRPEIDAWLTALLHGATPETTEQVRASVQVARIPAMRAMLTDAASNDLPRSLAAYPGPVLILAAPDESLPGPLRPGIEVRRLSTSSHWSTIDAPDEVNAALREFLQPVDAAAGRQRRSRAR